MKYNVCIGVDGYVNVSVDADSPDEARDKGLDAASELDLGELSDTIFRVACEPEVSLNQ